MLTNIIKKRIGIEKQIDDFLDQISQAALLFQHGVKAYLSGNTEIFDDKLVSIQKTEHRGDELRRLIEEQLYLKTLIPESRGDVLQLLEEMDSLLDRFKGALLRLDIELPEIDETFNSDFNEMAQCVVEAVEAIVRSVRAFFKDISVVSDHIHKVPFWESETDKVSTRLQKAIFRNKTMKLSHKNQIRDIVRHIDKIADRAEDVADRLSIFVIKRSL